jgi:hypothetical protein
VAGPYVAACGEIEALIAKDGKGVYGKYPTLAGILERIKPVMTRHKLTILQEPVTTEDGVGVATAILHESGARIQFDPLIIPIADRKPHTVGSALSYAKRYALTAVLGLAGDDDDDGQFAQASTERSERDSYKQKPKAAAATTNGTSHQARPAGSPQGAYHDDELWEPRETPKTADALSKAQLGRIKELGIQVYGKQEFETSMNGQLAMWVSNNQIAELTRLSVTQADTLITKLEKKITKAAAQVQAPSPSAAGQAAAN